MPIIIKGVEKLFHKLEATKARDVLTKPMERSVLRLQATMQVYPPPPAHSKYRRSGTLGKRWTKRVSGSGQRVSGRVGNNVGYGPFVQSSRFQTWFHARTGWGTDQQAVDMNEGDILSDFQDAIDRALAS